MPGRTSDVSVSTFKPLSLQEILMVPLAKRKMEDQFMAENDKLAAMQASTLAEAQEQASSIEQGFKDRSSALSDSVIEGGISRSDFNRLRSLRSEMNKEYSTGFLGRAQANQKAASKFSNDMATKKEMRGGWSPAQAQQHAMSQIADFKTQNEDGSFNTFTGRALPEKVDEDKLVKEAVDSVRGSLSQKTISILDLGGLDGIQNALKTDDLDVKDWNTVMEAILYKSQTNPDLLASLQQQALFSGETEDPLDMGSFEDIPNKDKPGESVRTFMPGKGRYGRKIFGAGKAAISPISKTSYKILEDGAATNMVKNGADEQAALDAMNYNTGTLENAKVPRQSKLRENLKTYRESVKHLKKTADKFKSNLIENNIKNGMSQEDAEASASSDKEYLRQIKEYEEASGRASNAQSRLDGMYKVVKDDLSEEQRKVLEIADLIAEKGDVFKALESVGGSVEKQDTKLQRLTGTVDSAYRAQAGAELFRIMGAGTFDFSDMIQDHFSNAIGPFGAAGRIEEPAWERRIMEAQDAMDEKSTEYIQSDMKADFYEIYDAEDTGKYSSEYGAWSKTASEGFNPKGKTMAYGKGQLSEEYLLEETGGINKDETKKNSKPEGYTYKVSETGSWDFNGSHFNAVKVTNNYTGETVTVPVVNDSSTSILRNLASKLKGGKGDQVMKGRILDASIKYMPFIKRSGMKMQDTGVMYIPGGPAPQEEGSVSSRTNTYKIEYTRKKSTADNKMYYEASVVSGNGDVRVPLNNGNKIYGESEMALAIDEAMKGIDKASRK